MSRVSPLRMLAVSLTSVALLASPGLTAVSTASPLAPDSATPTTVAVSTSPGVSAALAARHRTHIRLLDFSHTRRWHTRARIVGQVTAVVSGRRGALKRVHVRLFRRGAGSSSWKYLARTRAGSGSSPKFTFRPQAVGNADYKVVFRGNAKLKRSSATTTLLVHRDMRARLEDVSGNFHGTVRPKWVHRVIYLEKRSCATCSWHRVRSDQTGKRGHFRFYVPAPHSGRWWWRASVPAKQRFIRSYTGVFTTQLS